MNGEPHNQTELVKRALRSVSLRAHGLVSGVSGSVVRARGIDATVGQQAELWPIDGVAPVLSEVIGLDAIMDEQHNCSAKVLETSAVCELPFNQLEELSQAIPSLQHQMFRLMSKEIGEEGKMLTLLGKKNAEERLASFLISLSNRLKRRGFSATDFYLSMSRNEIGNYLGLAVETVSRLFTRFQDDGVVRVDRKHIELLDMERLESIARGNDVTRKASHSA